MKKLLFISFLFIWLSASAQEKIVVKVPVGVSTSQLADSLKNRISSIIYRNDSVFTKVNGVETFAFKYLAGALTAVNSGTPSNITGLLKGNGTSISAAVAGTDYLDSATGIKKQYTSAQN